MVVLGCWLRQVSLSVDTQLLPAVSTLVAGGIATPSRLWDGLPRGVVLHSARCGSTAVANMLRATPNTIVFAEPSFIYEAFILRAEGKIGDAELVLLLRLLSQMAALGGRELLSLKLPGSPGGQGGRAEQVFFKLQSNTPLVLDALGPGVAGARAFPGGALGALRAAWPGTAWAFAFRSPVESMSSLLHLDVKDKMPRLTLTQSPCLRSRSTPSAAVRKVLDDAEVSGLLPAGLGPLALTAEAYCAAHLAALFETVLAFDATARPNRKVLFLRHSELPGAFALRLLPHFRVEGLTAADRAAIADAGRMPAKNGSDTAPYLPDSALKRLQANSASAFWSRALVAKPYTRALRNSCGLPHRGGGDGGDGSGDGENDDEENGEEDDSDDDDDDEDEDEEEEDLDALGVEVTDSCRVDMAAVRGGDSPLASFGWATPPDIMVGTHTFMGGVYEVLVDGDAAQPPCAAALLPGATFSSVTEAAMQHFLGGDGSSADLCWRVALERFPALAPGRAGVLENLAVLEDTIARTSNFARMWHAKLAAVTERQPKGHVSASGLEHSVAAATELDGPDGDGLGPAGVQEVVMDGVLSDDLCDFIVKLFEESPKYEGNVINDRRVGRGALVSRLDTAWTL